MRLDLGVYYGGSSMKIAYLRVSPAFSKSFFKQTFFKQSRFWKDEKVSVIVNETGDRWTPSIVAINEAEFVILFLILNVLRNIKKKQT